jgi:predicted secreted hydrolase
MFYYSWPRGETLGEFRGKKVGGTAWMDHEYAIEEEDTAGIEKARGISCGWRWLSLLTSGPDAMEICVTQVCYSTRSCLNIPPKSYPGA